MSNIEDELREEERRLKKVFYDFLNEFYDADDAIDIARELDTITKDPEIDDAKIKDIVDGWMDKDIKIDRKRRSN